jgi:hypothetical protein
MQARVHSCPSGLAVPNKSPLAVPVCHQTQKLPPIHEYERWKRDDGVGEETTHGQTRDQKSWTLLLLSNHRHHSTTSWNLRF